MNKCPSRKAVADWIITSFQMIDPTIVKNSWRHAEFSYFPLDIPYPMGNPNGEVVKTSARV